MANALYGRCVANKPITISHGNMTMVFAPAQFWPTYWLAKNRVDFNPHLKYILRMRLKRNDVGKILRQFNQVTGKQIKMNWSDDQYKLVLFDRIKVAKIKVYFIKNTTMRSVVLSDSYLSVNCKSVFSLAQYTQPGTKPMRDKLAVELSQILMLRRSDKIRHDDIYWSRSRVVRGLIVTGAVITVFAEGIGALIKLVVVIVVAAYEAFNAVLRRFTELVLTGDFPALQRDLQKLIGGILHGAETVINNIKKGYDIITTIWGDESSRNLLFAFMKEYVDGTSVVDSATFKISLTIDILIIIGTLGAGAVVVGARLAQRVGQFTVRALQFIVDLYRALKLSRALRRVDVKKLNLKAPKPIIRQIQPPKPKYKFGKPENRKQDVNESNNSSGSDTESSKNPEAVAKSANKEIGIISTRTTKNKTRLGGESGELGIKIKYKNGTEFDMTRTRVKETEVNPYKPGRTRNKRFDNALDKNGIKRAPTKSELDWFNSIDY